MDNVQTDFHTDININKVNRVVDRNLLSPVNELLKKPGKRIREQIVRLGFLLGREDREIEPNESQEKLIGALSEVVESIHLGSLVVDDIQDQSQSRRGEPSLHRKVGEPLAINSGNFLYFWPMKWVEGLKLSERQHLEIYRSYFNMMTYSHMGQAIDLGTRIDQIESYDVPSLCLKSLELKTGELMAMAIEFGAIVAEASEERKTFLREFGKKFGVALQCYDDIGNLLKKGEEKYLEDLALSRPSFVWIAASNLCSASQYAKLRRLTSQLGIDKKSSTIQEIENWFERNNFISSATKEADEICADAFRILEKKARASIFTKSHSTAQSLCERIKNAYR